MKISHIFCVIVNSHHLEVSNTSWRQYSEDSSSASHNCNASSFASFPESIYIVLNYLILNRVKRKVGSYAEKWLACENLAEGGDRVSLVYLWYPKPLTCPFRTPLRSIRQFMEDNLCLTQKSPRNRFKLMNPERPEQNKQVQKQHKYVQRCSWASG